MTDYLASLIRTYIPVIIGALVAWLAVRSIHIDHATTTALTSGLTGLATAIYYGLVRAAETRWPALGRLLGVARTPAYQNNPANDRNDTTTLP